MRTKDILRHLAWGALGLASQQVFSQATQPDNNGGSGSFLGWDVGANQLLEIRNDAAEPIDFWTTGSFRVRINPRLVYPTLNSFSNIPAEGFTLISPDMGFLNQAPKGPFSRLHLAEGGEDDNAEQLGYRPWQRNGITFTGNGDQGYIGQKYSGDNETDMVIQWSDNPGNWKGDRIRFIFTGEYSASVPTGRNSMEGEEGMRLFPTVNDGINVGIGDFYAAGNIDPTERLDVLDGRARIRQLPDDQEADNLTKFVVVDDSPSPSGERGVLKWRYLPVVPPNTCASGWSLTGATTATAYDGNTCPPQDVDFVGIGTNVQGSSETAKLLVLNKNFDVGARADNARTTSGSNYGFFTDVTGGDYLNAGIEVNVHGSSTYTRGIRATTNGAVGPQGIGGAFLAYDNATYTIGAEGISYGGIYRSIGLHGKTTGLAAENYGVHGEAPNAANSYAGWFDGKVEVNGNLNINGIATCSAMAWGSDASIKTDVEDISGALQIIAQLQPKTYHFQTDVHPQMHLPEGLQHGLIAQELEGVLPDLVSNIQVAPVYDSTGTLVYEGAVIKGVNYVGLIPLLISGLQEQQAMILDLQDQMAQCCAANQGMAPQGSMDDKRTEQANELQEQRLLIIPNPVADLTTLEYYVPHAGRVSLSVSTSDGKPLGTLREEQAEAGAYSYQWNTTRLAAGTYFCTFLLDGAVVVKRAVKVK